MFYFFLVLTLISLAVIIFILSKKFPVLAVLNVENIPGEKEASFKKEIIKKRVDRDLNRFNSVFIKIWSLVSGKTKKFLSASESNLKKVKASYAKKQRISWSDKNKMIRDLVVEAEDADKKGDVKLAEEKLLEIISLDQKNLRAFYDLGKLYHEERKWTEASQTLRHALKIAAKRKGGDDNSEGLSEAEIYFSLALIGIDADKLDTAFEDISLALDREPNNPRYLDLILDLSIMRKDKETAERFLEKMAAINPENSKLQAWLEEIRSLEDMPL